MTDLVENKCEHPYKYRGAGWIDTVTGAEEFYCHKCKHNVYTPPDKNKGMTDLKLLLVVTIIVYAVLMGLFWVLI